MTRHRNPQPLSGMAWLPRLCAAALIVMASAAQAQHFDVELRTDKGPVAGSRIVTDFYGDLDLAGKLPFDAATGYRIFPAYFSDFAGGPYATANPGFQAFGGTFAPGEEIHFRALGSLLYWTPASGQWVAAPSGVRLTLYGGIPPEVVIGYSTNPAAWADQYAYYQAGTRFDGQGITGPLTALIDDAKAGGSFHSHLDWKIASSTGTPPVGAYLLTLELWSPTLSSGQPKYLPSQPFHVLFERGLTEAQMQAAFASRIAPPCEGRSLNWTVGGNQCAAPVPTTPSGNAALALDEVGPATGSASFTCTNGNWGAPSNASCVVPPPAACAAQTLGWTVGSAACSAAVPGSPSGTAATAIDTTLPATGSASFVCTNGQWSAPSNASCALPPPAACAARAMNWQVGADSCNATVAATPSGGTAVATDSAGPTLGSASFVCTDGQWSAPSNASCAVPPPAACAAQTLSWNVGSAACSAAVPTTPSNTSATATDTTPPATGSASFACTNGTWGAARNASCTTPPLACPRQTLAWTVGGQGCAATVPESPSGATLLATDDEAPVTGSASFICSDGIWSAPAAAACAAIRPIPPAATPAAPWAPPVRLPWDKPRR